LGVNKISVEIVLFLSGRILFSGLVIVDFCGVLSTGDPISNFDDFVLTPLVLGIDLI